MPKLYSFLIGVFFCLPLTAQTSVWENRGDSCMQAFNLYQALNCYSTALEQEDTHDLRMKIAECHYRRGNYRACISTLQPVPVSQLSHKALRQLFYSYKSLGLNDDLKQTGRMILSQYPMDAEVLVDLCHEYNLEGNLFGTFRAVDNYIAKDSTNLDVNRVIGEAEFFQKEYEGAKYTYTKLLAAGDSSYITYFSLGVCAEQLSRYDGINEGKRIDLQVEAVEYFSQAIAVSDSAQAAPLYHLGNIYNEMKNYQSSEKCFRKAMQLLSPDPSVAYICWIGLAESVYSRGLYQEAATAFDKALAIKPESVTAIYYLAVSLEGCGERTKAITQYEKFLNQASTVGNPSEYLKQMISDTNLRLDKLRK